MDISVKLGLTKGDSNVKALATVTIDNQFAIHGLKVVEGKKGDFIAYPSQKKELRLTLHWQYCHLTC